MNFATWSIRKPVPSLAFFLVMLVAGIYSFMRLPVTELPNVDIPIISVTIAQPGAAPAELAGQVLKPVEDAVANIQGVDHIISRAIDSQAKVIINFTMDTKTDTALNDVKDAVSRVRQDLPDTISEPIVKREELVGKPILTYGINNPNMSIEELSKFIDDVISRELRGIRGVGGVVRVGGADREIKVELDPNRLLALGITAADVNRQLRATNINLGAGRGDLDGLEFSIRALGSAQSVAQLAETSLTLPNGTDVKLNQLGLVYDGPAEARNFAMLDGHPVVALGIYRQAGFSDLDTARKVAAQLKDIKKRYPGISISKIDDSTIQTEGSYNSAMETLYEGAALAVIVVFMFLRDWRATIITALALPLSIIPTFFAMYFLGFSLNLISLLGITLVTGILVDDAIVEIENIERHRAMGKSARKAAADAATEIGLTVIAITLSIVAVFAPVSFMGGIPGQFFKQFGLTVAIAALFSLLVARLITPMMAAYFLKDMHKHGSKDDGWLMRGYLSILRWTLRHRIITIVAAFAIFAASLYSATLLPGEFTPKKDIGRSLITVELPPGATLDDTRKVAREMTDRIWKIPEIRNVFVDGGSGSITRATLIVNYGTKLERKRTSFQIEDDMRRLLADIPDVRINFVNERGQKDISMSVLGDNREEVRKAALRLADAMKKRPELRNVTTTAALPRPEIQIRPKGDLAAELGVTANLLASTLRVATIGDVNANLAKFNSGDEQIPIRVRLRESARKDLTNLAGIRVRTPLGVSVPLLSVADVKVSTGPSVVTRYDRKNETKVETNLGPNTVLGQATDLIMSLPEARNMPKGTRIQASGDAEIMADIFSGFATAMAAGIMLVYVVLALLFSSFVTPITILMTLPLAIGGAIFALYMVNLAISLPVVIGFLMLMGIVTKNAIMLVGFAQDSMKQGLSRPDAMLEAGHKRARPIVMTTIAMTSGMIPSALAVSIGGEFRSPMAIAVMGGLILSTLLSLVFVPVLFSLIDGSKEWVMTRLTGGRNLPEKPSGGPEKGAIAHIAPGTIVKRKKTLP